MDRVRSVFHVFSKSSLLSGAAVYVLGNILQKAAAFLLIPLYTYFLSPEDFGITGIVQSATQVLIILFALGINAAVQRYYYEYYEDENQLKQYISSTFLFLTAAASVASLGLLFWGKHIWDLLFRQVPFVPYAQLMIWTVWGSVLTQYALNLYRARQEAGRFVITQIGSFLLTAAVSVYLVAFRHLGAKGQLMGLLAGAVVTATVSSVIVLRDYFVLRVDWKYVRVSLVYGLPLIPHLVAQWGRTSLDRLILENHASLDEVGLYTLGFNLGLFMQVLVLSTNQAYVPYFFEMMNKHPEPKGRFREVAALYVAVFGAICLAGVLFGREALQFLAPPLYFRAAEILPLILFGFLINGYYFLFVNPLFYFKRTAWIPWVTGIGAATSVGLNLILIPRLGALGAAWSFVISTTLTFVLTFFVSSRFWKVQLPLGRYLLLNAFVFVVVLWKTYGGYTQGLMVFLLNLLVEGLFLLAAYLLLLRVYWRGVLARVGNAVPDQTY